MRFSSAICFKNQSDWKKRRKVEGEQRTLPITRKKTIFATMSSLVVPHTGCRTLMPTKCKINQIGNVYIFVLNPVFRRNSIFFSIVCGCSRISLDLLSQNMRFNFRATSRRHYYQLTFGKHPHPHAANFDPILNFTRCSHRIWHSNQTLSPTHYQLILTRSCHFFFLFMDPTYSNNGPALIN